MMKYIVKSLSTSKTMDFLKNKSYIFAHKRLTYITMEQKKIEHITLNLIVFGTIVIIGVLARQTVLHYGWDEFSSNLILVVCSIIMGAIYLNLQMVFGQLLSPTIEKCFMRFECYRNKAVVVETPTIHSKLVESTINSKLIISELNPKWKKSKLHLTQQKKFLFLHVPNSTKTWLNFQKKTPHLLPSIIYLSKNPISQQNMRCSEPMLWQRKSEHHKKS